MSALTDTAVTGIAEVGSALFLIAGSFLSMQIARWGSQKLIDFFVSR